MINSSIYNGQVIHKRFKPKIHSFKYSVFSLLIDLSELEILNKDVNFVSYNQSSNEIKNRLEQLRALDNNIRINVALAKSSPIGVDTEEDFVAIKKIMEYKSK